MVQLRISGRNAQVTQVDEQRGIFRLARNQSRSS